jgi:lambda repressor-like predicted transcriptional regulator
MPLVDPKLRKRMTALQRSLARRTTPASRARVSKELQRLAEQRRSQVELGTTYNPAASLTPQGFKGTVDSLVKGEVDPLKRQRGATEAGGQKSIADITAVFKTLGESMAAGVGRGQGIAQQALQNVQQSGQQQVAAQAAAGQQASAEIDKDEALRGVGNAPPREALATLIAQRGADTAQLQSAQQARVAQLGASDVALQNAMAGSAGMQGTQQISLAQGQLASRLSEIDANIADAEGPGRTKIIQDLRGSERQWLGEQAAFGIDQQKLAADQRNKRAQRAVTKRGQTLSHRDRQAALRQQQREKKLDRQLKRELKTTGAAGGRTPSQIRSDQQNRNKAIAKVKSFNQAKNGRLANRTANGRRLREQAINGMMKDFGYSRAQARAVLQRVVPLKRKPQKQYSGTTRPH